MLQHNLLPRNVQRKLRNGETVVAEHHTASTVLWAEVVGLPRLAAEVPPLELVGARTYHGMQRWLVRH